MPEREKIPLERVLLLCCVTVIAYLPALRNGFAWDDDSMLTHNGLIRAGSGLYRFWFTTQPADYWPVTSTALWMEWRLWGLHAFGYHAVNLALHVGEALMLWAILRRLKIPGAYLAAFLFAVHPMNVETVAWISEIKNLMAMLFFLASVGCFLKTNIFCDAEESRAEVGPRGRQLHASQESAADGRAARPYPGEGGWYWLSLLAFTLGMLSKGSVAILPGVFLGLIAWQRRIGRQDILRLAPFFLVGLILAGVDVWFQKHGTGEVIRHAGVWERWLGAGAVVWFYLGKALWPAALMFVYPQWHIRVTDPLWWAPLLAAAVLTILLWRGRRRFSRPALFAWGYFCLALVPVMGFTDVYFMKYSLVADHYAHLALIGVVAVVAAGWERLGRAQTRSRGRAKSIAAGAVIGLLAFLTWRQSENYRDARTLFLATLRQNPACALADNYLATTPPSAGRPEAIAYLEKAVAADPDYAEAQDNLAAVLFAAGRLPEALVHYEALVQLRPEWVKAHNNLGGVLRELGRTDEAIAQFETTLRLDPGYAPAHTNLANILLALPGRLPEAIEHYETAARLAPGSASTQANLGHALAAAGRLPEALVHDEQAVRLDPASAPFHINLGQALLQEGRAAEAQAQFDEAARLRAHP